MKFLFILLWAVAYQFSEGYPVNEDKKLEEVPIQLDSSHYLKATTSYTSSKDFLLQHGIYKVLGDRERHDQIKKIVAKEMMKKSIQTGISGVGMNSGKILGGRFTRRVKVTKTAKWLWALPGIGLFLLVKLTWCYCREDKSKKDSKCEVQNSRKKSISTCDIGRIEAIPLPYK